MYYYANVNNEISHYVINKPFLSRLAKIFVAILLIAFFEGAIRKWVSSALTNPIVLLRDAMAIYGILWAIYTKRVRFSQFGGQLLILWTFAFLTWGLFQLIVGQSSVLVFIVGARFWLLYLWFAYAASVTLTEYDFNVISKLILSLLLVMIPLAVMQHFLSPGAFLNRQVDSVENTVFRVTADIVRTTGTFSFTIGYTVFLALATPFVLANLVPQKKLWARQWSPVVFLLLLSIGTIVSGSRGAIINFLLLFILYSFSSILYAKKSNRGATVAMIGLVVMVLTTLPYLFSRAIIATQSRFESASESENIYSRLVSMFLGEVGIYKNLSLIGHGFGQGTNFAGIIAHGERSFLLAETETARTILEGGLFGIILVLLKLLLITVGIRKSWGILRSTGNTLPFLLWITTGIALMSWAIAGQLTVNVLGCLLLSLAIAALRLFARK